MIRNMLFKIYFFLLSCLIVMLAIGLTLPIGGTTAQAFSHANSPQSTNTALQDPRELEAFLDGVFKTQLVENHIPGATVAVVKDGRLLLSKGYGYADLKHDKRVDAATSLFPVASVSKLFTWTAVMQLMEQHKLDLHTDVNQYLKTFHIPATYPQPITLESLLTHTAGFEDRDDGGMIPTPRQLQPLGTWLANHIPARVRPPGKLASYSNYGAALAGYIVELVSGIPFDQYIETNLYKPLNMRHSTFRQPVPAQMQADISQGYAFIDGWYRSTPPKYFQVAPAVSMYTTATDIANFMIAQLQNGRFGDQRILQDATAQQMHEQHFTSDPHIPGLAYGFEVQRINGQRLLQHGGDIPSFHSLLNLLPDHNVGVFVSYNSDGGSAARTTLLQAFMNHYYPVPRATIPPSLPGFAERASKESGIYWSLRRPYTTYEKIMILLEPGIAVNVINAGYGHLLISGGGGSILNVVEVSPGVYQQMGAQQQVIFQQRQDGTVMFIGNSLQSYGKMAWYDSRGFHVLLILACLLIFLSALLLWPVRLLRTSRLKRSGEIIKKNTVPQTAYWLAGTVCAINVIVPIYLVWSIASHKNPALVLPVILALGIISAILTGIVILFTTQVWRNRFWIWPQRIHYILVVLAALAFVWELAYWNLLG
ncbi:FmtA-like protein [Dictyobacter sp. S3.2.2.5]|uniref:FmtA-like protein n=1 Tax=Dictyobacter halimunensis TaxID=3026934 RepID=A0ABQ6FLH0_9CHLR|nr:FmtA-like protein [Dictyobacter sp. S3.2.2.5]